MSFQPVLPLTGYAGWRFLQRTLDTQQAHHSQSPNQTRLAEHFLATAPAVHSAAEFVEDRQLMEVALSAFGLQDDLGAKAFVRRILESNPSDETSLVNRLADKRYLQFANAFGFGSGFANMRLPRAAENIVKKFESKSFEMAVGEQDNSLRIALSSQSELNTILSENSTENARWYAIMGNPPMRELFQTAFGFPSAMAQIDVEQQLVQFKERASSVFGTSDLSKIAVGANYEKLTRLYLARDELASSSAYQSGQVALALLQSSGSR